MVDAGSTGGDNNGQISVPPCTVDLRADVVAQRDETGATTKDADGMDIVAKRFNSRSFIPVALSENSTPMISKRLYVSSLSIEEIRALLGVAI